MFYWYKMVPISDLMYNLSMASTAHFFCINEKENYRISWFLSEVHPQKMHSVATGYIPTLIWFLFEAGELWEKYECFGEIQTELFSLSTFQSSRCIFWLFEGPESSPTNPRSQSSIKSAELQIAIGENNLFVEMFRISPGLWTGLPVHLMILPSEQTISLIRPDITVIQMAHGTMMVKAKEYWPGQGGKVRTPAGEKLEYHDVTQ